MQTQVATFRCAAAEHTFFASHDLRLAAVNEAFRKGIKRFAYHFRMENSTAKRCVDLTLLPPTDEKPVGVFQVYIEDLSTGERFNLCEYLRQHHGVNPETGFRTDDYEGSFEDRVAAFLEFATGLLQQYAEPVLDGTEWPQVHFDWGGTR